MVTGIFAGIMWALETVILDLALNMSPLIETEQAIFLAPFAATFFHDAFSALLMLIYNAIRGNLKKLSAFLKTKNFWFLVLASAIGGPVGMTGYVMAVKFMGASVGAVASAVYPAVGTALAFFFLKEKVKWYQWLFLAAALFGVYGLSYSPSLNVTNVFLGLLGAVMCALGWGIEAVILAKCLKAPELKSETALWIRQSVSCIVYGFLILPAIGGTGFAAGLLREGTGAVLPTIFLAALCASLSYLCYYRTIAKVGASKAMALNITYTSWAIVFTVILLKDTRVLNPLTLICAGIVVVCGILAATDFRALFSGKG